MTDLLQRVIQILRYYIIYELQSAVLNIKVEDSEGQVDSLIQLLLVAILQHFLDYICDEPQGATGI